jgi:serine/threonine protein kinase
MPLQSPSDKVGPYEIIGSLGEGGMGEVLKARDTRLNRNVAVKFSKDKFSDRFTREAQAIAALNHPNVCTLYDVGPNYLVMELVEGPTLAERIKEGPIPLEEVLKIAKQIADALEAAHEKGIVHRDLKPGNIKIKPDGPENSNVKVLDFGLAKMGAGAAAPGAITDDSPTISMLTATQAGVILGTAAYMAPEQARGKTVDKRADIWAFGVVLYEMLTGEQLFQGQDVTEILASVLKEEPDFERIPAKARAVLRRCLEKDPKNRLRDIGDAMAWLEVAPVEQAILSPAMAENPIASTGNHRRLRLPWSIAAVFVLATLGLSAVHFREKAPAPPDLMRFQFPTPPVNNALNTYLALSPDGKRIAYTANGPDSNLHLWVRSLDTLEAHMLPGTENGVSAFWSPDGKYLGFAQGNILKKVDASGAAPPLTLCEAPGTVGQGTWSPEGVIVFGGRGQGPLRKVSAAGGTPMDVTSLAPNEGFHTMPYFLLDGRHFVYLRGSADLNIRGIYTGSLDTKPSDPPSKRVLQSQFNVAYAPSSDSTMGRLLFLRENTLMAQPFDTGRLELTGDPLPVADRVAAAGSFAQFAVSATGTLAYRSGEGSQTAELTWFDRKGTVLGHAGNPAEYRELNLSPDGKQVATFQASGQSDIWIYEFARGTNTRLTFDPGSERYPVWSPDGKQVAYSANSGGPANGKMFRRAADGSGEPELLPTPQQNAYPLDWSRDGRFLLYVTLGGILDIWALPLQDPGGAPGKAFPVANTAAIEVAGQFSPDGRWVVYQSIDSTGSEIYVRPFTPGASGSAGDAKALTSRWMISNNGGIEPRWRRDGKEILYLSSSALKLMSVEVNGAGTSFQAGVPKPLFDVPIFGGAGIQSPVSLWDMTPDGQRFLVTSQPRGSSGESQQITVVLNWPSAVKK